MTGMETGLAWLASAAGFAVAMTASPGPNNAMVAASAANFGVRRTVPHMLGIAVGFPLMLVLVALGAAELLREQPGAMQVLRWVGAAWMLWMAWRIATAAPAEPGAAARARPMRFLEAALFQWVNPKAWIMAGGAIATFTGGAAGLLAEALSLALLFGLVAVVCLWGWAALGAGAARLLSTQGALRWFNRAIAALLVLSVVTVV